MKIIIDLDENVFVRLFDNDDTFTEVIEKLEKEYQIKDYEYQIKDYDDICTAIRGGTVVPKGFKVKVTND